MRTICAATPVNRINPSRMKTKFCCAAFCLALVSACWAQSPADDPEWAESQVPAPPAFDISRLLHFDVSVHSSMVFGVDPATLLLTSDGVVRYVVVATSPSGVRNVFYEGLRCATAQFKTYGWNSSNGKWQLADKPTWRSIYAHMPSKHALALARNGLCQGDGPAASVEAMVRQLKLDGKRLGE